MKWEYLGTGLALIGIGITLMVALPPPWWPRMPTWSVHAGVIVGAVLVVAGVALSLVGFWPDVFEARLGPTALIAVAFGLGIVGVIWFSWIEPTPGPQFTWAWEPLPDEQGKRIADALKDKKIGLIYLAYTASVGAELAGSFKKAFEEANSKTASIDDARTNILFPGLTGIGVYAHGDLAQALKSAISSNTHLRVSIIEPRNRVPSPEPTVVIGAKSISVPAPPELQKELNELVSSLSVLSRSLSDFSADRQREKGRIPVPQGAREAWESSVAFSNETEALLDRKFGEQITMRNAQLSKMGIVMARSVLTSRDPGKFGKWFAVVASILQKGNIEEARTAASNEEFWFPR